MDYAVPLTAADVVRATGGELVQGSPDVPVGRVVIDSRTVQPGELFVALHGERFDGHRFVDEAMERGAAGAVVDEQDAVTALTGRPRALCFRVADTTRALQNLARDVRRRSGAQVVAITGSAGKTTTKEITAEFLSTRYRVFRNKGNLNNHIGLPLSLLELRSKPEIAVVELGMNHPGEIRTLVGIAEPEVRVWTNVGDAHLGFFPSADAIADAKAEILERARPDHVLVANADDERIMARAGGFAGRRVTFGLTRTADVRATEVELAGLEGSRATLHTPQGDAPVATRLLGAANLSNILAASATALQFEIPLASIVERAAQLRPATHRGELLRLPGGVTLIDDSYNSSPSALARALEVVAATTGCARKVAVLGEMLELGEHAASLHVQSGRVAAEAGLDLLIAVGGLPAAALAEAAKSAGMPESSVVRVTTSREAAEVALSRVRPGDLVLVKGSRGIGTDLVVERLREEFA